MDIDKVEDAGEDEDEDEIGPGCGILDIAIPGISPSKLWVRKEYIKLYEYCEEYLGLDHDIAPSVVITGLPGIGRTYWVLYALCRRLSEGKPVIWYYSSERYIFVNDGVFVEPSSRHYPAAEFKTYIWTLVDVDGGTQVPEHLAVHCTKHLIIFTSSPQPERWKGLEKTTLCRVVIMNPWTRAEISKAATLYKLKPDDPRLDKMYYEFGPTPRICFRFLDGGMFQTYLGSNIPGHYCQRRTGTLCLPSPQDSEGHLPSTTGARC